jgi:ABC-type sulfate/molybdate transport systems ATPase subunit
MAASAVLEVKDLCAAQGSFRLGPISFRLQRGESLALMGPSGCGKTTLLKALAGIVPLASGEILMDCRDIGRLPSRQRGVGYLPQNLLLFPHLTVEANVRFGMAGGRDGKARREARFAEVVEWTGIAELLRRFPATLSGGESRRVALARALAVSPPVLLLDEPLSMLDPAARASLLEVLRGIRDRTDAVILHVTHLEDEAREAATRRLSMSAGRLVEAQP